MTGAGRKPAKTHPWRNAAGSRRAPTQHKQNQNWGLCTRCGGAPRPGKRSCAACATADKAAHARMRQRRNQEIEDLRAQVLELQAQVNDLLRDLP